MGVDPGVAMGEGAAAGPAIRRVAGRRGIQWVAAAWRDHLARDPLPWILTTLLWVALMAALGFVPLLGPLAQLLTGPALVAGFLLGAAAQARGEHFAVDHLFAALARPGQLLLLGALQGAAALLVLAGAGAAAAALLWGGALGPSAAALVLAAVVLFCLLALAAFWFAPARVALRGRTAWQALRDSLRAVAKNWLPLGLQGLALFALFLVALLPLGLGLLLWWPLAAASLYRAHDELFPQAPPPFPTASGDPP
ncbi:MAG: hypothetical protein KatS3mg124_0588 [Porticoccaceae bacterium]|nr:MAG: hypothetical protein KatS3mg124_0588 [Porticoccaceae bacterium]